jgi:hypothetical protein
VLVHGGGRADEAAVAVGAAAGDDVVQAQVWQVQVLQVVVVPTEVRLRARGMGEAERRPSAAVRRRCWAHTMSSVGSGTAAHGTPTWTLYLASTGSRTCISSVLLPCSPLLRGGWCPTCNRPHRGQREQAMPPLGAGLGMQRAEPARALTMIFHCAVDAASLRSTSLSCSSQLWCTTPPSYLPQESSWYRAMKGLVSMKNSWTRPPAKVST